MALSSGILGTALGSGGYEFLATLYPHPAERHEQARWSQPEVRWLRYFYLWSFYDQSIYWGGHAELIKREQGLYRNIRPILNRIRQIVEFDVAHVQGGRLDMWAGDGKATPSALPIVPGERADRSIHRAIAELWRCSRWQRAKSLFVRLGSALGDGGIELIDDAATKRIRMRVIHPAEVRNARHRAGELVAVTLERAEVDPDGDGDQTCLYREVIEKDARGKVSFQTFKGNLPYRWPGMKADAWDSPLPFIPVVLYQWIDQGFPWGLSEISGSIAKSMEMDDQGSNVADGVRKMVNGPWLLKGAVLPKSARSENPWRGDPFAPPDASENVYQVRSIQVASRQDMPIIECAGPDAGMTPLVYPVPVSEVVAFLAKIGDSLEQEYPELQVDLAAASGAASGRALRVARQKAAQKIEERRGGPDECLTRAQMYALVMGGMAGYDAYKAFNRDSIEDGRADHHIGDRPAFGTDPLDSIEIAQARALALKTYVEFGMDPESAMEQLDYDPKDIKQIMDRIKNRDAESAKAETDRMNALATPSEGFATDSADAATTDANPVDEATGETPP